MSRSVLVNFSTATFAMLRPDDAVSGRINQIADRYNQLMTLYGEAMRDDFTGLEWKRLLAVYGPMRRDMAGANIWKISERLCKAIGMKTPLAVRVDDMPGGELVALLELLEAELAKAEAPAPATHS